ncbi:growth/differentiation factor 8 [Parasteatoda tepidariorum]|uniref:growth/differentiation factor 8 n=1 Tax=Parasteatoda tepidariorum TaxID=114398 RepID=UPI00077FD654|nr:growth/differentiation factor 8 [Parasteatoda tepidariorum]
MMAFKILIVSFVFIFGSVNMSPFAPRTIEPDENEIRDLFYMSKQEELFLEENSVDNTVVEKVKTRILKGLNMTEPPRTFQPIPPLLHFIPQNNSWSGFIKSKTASKTSENGMSEFFLSELVPNTCFDQNVVRCIRFQIDLKGVKIVGKTAEIWLYKREGIRQFTISQLNKDSTIREKFKVTDLSKLAKWIRLDATVLLNSDVLDLEVSALALPIETGKDKNPVLIVKNSKTPQRNKRSPNLCEDGATHCCLKDYHISFKDIGWDSWIIEPSGYKANICKGSCENRMDMAENNHSSIMITLLSKGKIKIPDEIKNSIHCSPKEFKALPIIYIAESGIKIITNLPNMTVTHCACR